MTNEDKKKIACAAKRKALKEEKEIDKKRLAVVEARRKLLKGLLPAARQLQWDIGVTAWLIVFETIFDFGPEETDWLFNNLQCNDERCSTYKSGEPTSLYEALA